MRLMLLGTLWCLLWPLSTLKAQYVPGLETTYLGMTASQPRLKNGFAADGLWTGPALRIGPLNIEINRGNLFQKGRAQADRLIPGYMASVSYTAPFFKYYNENKLSLGTVRFVPFWEGGVTYVRAGINGPEDRAFSWGIKTSLGLTIRMPFLFIELKPNGYALINHTLIKKADNQNAFSGLGFAPSITIGIDGLWDILRPEFFHQKVHTIEDFSRTHESKYEGYDWGDADGDGNITEKVRVTTTRTETWKEHVDTDYDFELIKPYFSVGARVTAWPEGFDRGHTLMYGPQIGTRFGMFGFEGFFMTGKASVKNGIHEDILAEMDAEDANFSFRGTQQLSTFGGTVLFDMVKMNIPRNRVRKLKENVMTKHTSMNRMMLRLNYQYSMRNGGVAYTYDNARSELQSIEEDRPGTLSDPKQNPDLSPEAFHGLGFGFGFEVGIVALSYDLTWHLGAPVMNRNSFTLSANVPWGKVYRGFRSQARYRKAERQARKAGQ